MRLPRRAARALPLVEPIVPVARSVAFDDPAYLFEPNYDGFRGLLYVSRIATFAQSGATS
jgi:hypothetical protein